MRNSRISVNILLVLYSGGGMAQMIERIGLVIERLRLRNLDSIRDAVARRCVLGKDT